MEVDYSSSVLFCDRRSRNQIFYSGGILRFLFAILLFLAYIFFT